VVSHLLKLHEHVEHLDLIASLDPTLVDHVYVSGKDFLIELLLQRREPHKQEDFLLGR
jgi:hypothetical protein